MSTTQTLTFGQRACGVSFNPGGNPAVAAAKEQFAALVDTLHAGREATPDPEVKRMFSIAITEVQSAQMWTVKAITWNL
jgi:hypothetical protein